MGGPPSQFGCALAGLGQSVARVKILGRSTPKWLKYSWPEVIGANTLNFKVNFKFSGLKFFGGTPSQFGCALAGLGQTVARVKISGRSTP